MHTETNTTSLGKYSMMMLALIVHPLAFLVVLGLNLIRRAVG